MAKFFIFCILSIFVYTSGQRITTIHLDGVQYFISRMNPYSPELNYFLAYQYCRSLGLQLASFETKEKTESMTTYLKNAGYGNYDFWTSGNRLGTGMFLWMSTGLPFNATFDFFEQSADVIQAGILDPVDHNSNTSPQRTARDSGSGAEKACVILKQPALKWMPEDCSSVKDFICEQTRCYYYNYGSIPVSSAQGRPITSTTPRPTAIIMQPASSTSPAPQLSTYTAYAKKISTEGETNKLFIPFNINNERLAEDKEDEEIHEDVIPDDIAEHMHDPDFVKYALPKRKNDLEEHTFMESSKEFKNSEEQIFGSLNTQIYSDIGKLKNDFEIEDKSNDDDNIDSIADSTKDDSLLNKYFTKIPTSSEEPEDDFDLKQIPLELDTITRDDKYDYNNNNSNNNDKDDSGHQSFLSLTDLIRTLRPNEKHVIPQIDSDYSNAKRVLAENSAVVTNNDFRKLKDVEGLQLLNQTIF